MLPGSAFLIATDNQQREGDLPVLRASHGVRGLVALLPVQESFHRLPSLGDGYDGDIGLLGKVPDHSHLSKLSVQQKPLDPDAQFLYSTEQPSEDIEQLVARTYKRDAKCGSLILLDHVCTGKAEELGGAALGFGAGDPECGLIAAVGGSAPGPLLAFVCCV